MWLSGDEEDGLRVESAAKTHIGPRTQNEDSFCVRPELGLFVVADGLGGQAGGEVASRCVVDAFTEFGERMKKDGEAAWPQPPKPERTREENVLLAGTALAQRALLEQRVGYLWDMGSTVVALAAFCWVEARAAQAVLPMRLFGNPVFTVCSILSFIVGFAMLGAMTFLPTFLQYVDASVPQLRQALATKPELTDDVEKQLKQALDSFKSTAWR